MRPLTDVVPKPLLPIDGVPALTRVLELLAQAGCLDVSVVVGYKAEAVMRLAGDGSAQGVRVSYVRQEPQLGSGHAVAAGMDGMDWPTLTIAADIVLPEAELHRFVDAFRHTDAEAIVAVEAVTGPGGNEAVVSNGRMLRVMADEATGLVVAPVYGLRPSVKPYLEKLVPAPSGALQLADALQSMIDDGLPVEALELRGIRHLTTPVDVLKENFAYLRPYLTQG